MNGVQDVADTQDAQRQRRRLRGFGIHLLCYFAVMTVLAIVNLSTSPETPWFVLPMVGWGSVLAIHAAWAMGLLDTLFQGGNRE